MESRRNFFIVLGIGILILVAIAYLAVWRGNQDFSRILEEQGYHTTEDSRPPALPFIVGGSTSALFFLLAWRNNAGLVAERRHQEIVRILNRILWRIEHNTQSDARENALIAQAQKLWAEGQHNEALELLGTMSDSPRAQRLLAKIRERFEAREVV